MMDDNAIVVHEENEMNKNNRTNTDNAIGIIANKRRRLSKKERKILKKKNKGAKQKNDNLDQPIVRSTYIHTTVADSKSQNEQENNADNDVESVEERIRISCMKSYDPINIPKEPSTDLISRCNKSNTTTTTVDDETGARTLGKWFPNAILIKSSISYTNTGNLITGKDKHIIHQEVENPRSSLVLFYQYTTSDAAAVDNDDEDNNNKSSTRPKMWDRQQLQLLITYLSTVARHRNLGGRIRVAPEGVNATLSAVDTLKCTAKAALRHLGEDLKKFDPKVFSGTDFKYFDDLPADRHFTEFKILPVQELVFYDISENEAPLTNDKTNNEDNDIKRSKSGAGGIHLDAKEYHKMLQKENTVVIDVRNHYEALLGRFDGQMKQQESKERDSQRKSENNDSSTTNNNGGSGAKYIDPKMRKSTDFKSWLATPETKKQLNNKTVLMYCTGGIRCERASAYLKSQMGNEVEGIYQLKGGIERYLKTYKDGGFWRGKNFVFDKREAVSVDNPHGDGGIIRKQDKKRQKNGSTSSPKCCVCGDFWDRYIGKKKCSTCGVPVLMCDKCMSLKLDKTPGKELMVRCPLCVEEKITVLAKELEFTANGIKNKLQNQRQPPESNGVNRHSMPEAAENSTKVKEISSQHQTGKAADSVLKWGGGHANKKKERKKMKRRSCQFGTDCVRQDCFFYHPERESSSKKKNRAEN